MVRKNKTPTVRCGAVQQITTWRDPANNIARSLAYCDKAAKRGVQILCFPECAVSGGFDWLKVTGAREKLFAEPVPGPVVNAFAAKARQTGMYIIMGMIEQPRGSAKQYNTAFVVGPEEGYIGKQRKVFSSFEDGTEANVFETRYGTIGIFICADMRSPELSRLLALKGAKILFQPTNYSHPDMRDPYAIRRKYLGKVASQRCRAMENGLPLIIANGGQAGYVNNSRIITAEGQGPEVVLARATRKDQLIVADVPYNPADNSACALARSRPWLWRELARAARAAARRRPER